MTSGNQSDDPAIHATRVEIGRGAWVAPNATLTGRVTLGALASVWFGCVLRGDLEPIAIGDETNVQDLTVVHVDRGCPALVGSRVTIGHRAVIHGCSIDDDAVIGMGAVLLSGSHVGRGALVAAGAVLREGFTVPPGAIAAGVPAVIGGEVGPELRQRFRDGLVNYLRLAARYRSGA
jgi:carbonic anhydrase/acetyltransferase-like protein (isoleucine patch superfamily)